jgi:hypothetical protein
MATFRAYCEVGVEFVAAALLVALGFAVAVVVPVVWAAVS